MLNSNSNSTVRPVTEDVSSQLDRLNTALEEVMHQISLSSPSRNPSRQSILTTDVFNDDTIMSEVSVSESPEYDSTIEKLLQSLDRHQMNIEDFRSEEMRKPSQTVFEDLQRIRKEVWSELRMQQKEVIDREMKNLTEKIRAVEGVKQDYLIKKQEIAGVMQKLRHKEQLLAEKEAEIRAQRLTLEKSKMDWEIKQKTNKKTEPATVTRGHARANSYSFLAAPRGQSAGLDDSQSLHDKLRSLQTELEMVQVSLRTCENSQKAEKEVRIESIKNKIATIRGEIAINEANKGSELISFMMESLQKEAFREEKAKKAELAQAANKCLKQFKPPLVPSKVNCGDRVEGKGGRKGGVMKENDEEGGRKREWAGEKEWKERERLLKKTFMRLPDAKGLVEDANLMLAKFGAADKGSVEMW